MTERDITIFEGAVVGAAPMPAGFLVHAVVKEAGRLSTTRVKIVSVTVKRTSLSIRVEMQGQTRVDLEKETVDVKALFSEIARVAYAKCSGSV